jgi:hypothetical protein
MMLLDKLVEAVMHYEASTGRQAIVSMTSKYLQKLLEDDKYFTRAEGYIAGIPFYIDNEQKEDYIIK